MSGTGHRFGAGLPGKQADDERRSPLHRVVAGFLGREIGLTVVTSGTECMGERHASVGDTRAAAGSRPG